MTPSGRSPAETLLAVQLADAHIIFDSEFRFHPKRRWRADFMIGSYTGRPDWSILVEVEGGAYVQGRHTRGPAFEADCEKYAAAAILGYRVIRVTPRQVEDGRALAWIKAALGLEERAA